MTIEHTVRTVRRMFGESGLEQAARHDSEAVRWDGMEAESRRHPGRWVPGSFAAEAQFHRDWAEEIRAWVSEHGDVA